MLNPKTANAIKELKTKIEKEFKNSEIILFGSAATGTADSESDIDLLILVDGDLDNTIEEKIFETSFDVELNNDVIFGIIAYPKKFWHSQQAQAMPLYQNIAREGIAV